ncbi:hypothetical protein ACLOJK_014485 [Asimina triloba]
MCLHLYVVGLGHVAPQITHTPLYTVFGWHEPLLMLASAAAAAAAHSQRFLSMAADPEANPKPVLQRPPGYKDPNAPLAARPPTMRKPPMNRPIYPPKRRRRSCCRRCCCFIFVFILCVLILAAITGALFYIWYRPKLPSFRVQSVETPRFRVSVRADGTYLDSQTVVRLLAKNPNSKMGFSYGRTEVRVRAKGAVGLGSGWVAAFDQDAGESKVVSVSMKVNNQLVDDDVGRRLKGQFQSKQMVVDAEVRTRFGVRIGGLSMGKVPVRVLCTDVRLHKTHGKGSPKCRINIFKWSVPRRLNFLIILNHMHFK